MAEMDALMLAKQARAAGDFKLALERCNSAIELAPDHLGIRLFRAQLLSDLKHWHQALADFEFCIAKTNSLEAGPWLGLIHCLRNLKKTVEAEKKAREGLERNPSSTALKLVLAETQREIGQWDAAEQGFASIIDNESEVPAGAFMGLGACIGRREGLAASLPFYEKAHNLAPNLRGPRLAMADVMRDIGRFQEAERIYKDLLLENKSDFQSAIGLAIIYRRRDGLLAACHYYKVAIGIDPGNLIARMGVADCLFASNGYVEAGNRYKNILSDYPENSSALLGAASCVRETEGIAAALIWYKKAAECSSNDRRGELEYANALKSARRFDEARDLYEGLLSDASLSISALSGLAVVVQEMQGPKAALNILKKAVDSGANDKSIRLKLAELLSHCGEREEAKNIYRVLLEEHPEMVQVHLGLYSCIRNTDGLELGLLQLERSKELHSKNQGIGLAIADTLRELKSYEESDRRYFEIAVADSRSFQSYIGIGLNVRARFGAVASYPYFEYAYYLKPENRTVRWLLCESMIELGRYDEAIIRVNLWLNEMPASAYLHFLRGKIIRASHGLTDDAVEAFAQTVDLASDDFNILKDCADILREAGIVERSIAIYDELISKRPSHKLAKLGLIQSLFAAGNINRARDMLAMLASENIKDCRVLAELIRVALRIGANDHLRTIVLDSGEFSRFECVDCMVLCAQHMMANSEYEDACRLIERALSIDYSREGLKIDFAFAKMMLGDRVGADAIVSELLSKKNTPVDVLVRISHFFSRNGQNSEALACAYDAFESPGAGMAAYLALIAALDNAGSTDEAMRVVDSAVQIFGLHIDIAISASRLMRGVGNRNGSREVMTAAGLLESSLLPVLFELFRIEFASGELEAAERYLDRMRPLSVSDHAEMSFCRAQLCTMRWNHHEAIRFYREVIQFNRDHAEAHRQLAYCFLAVADIESARIHLDAFTKSELPIRQSKGLPLNKSQSHLGQLVDEYLIDRDVMRDIEKLNNRDPWSRVSGLMEMHRTIGESTATAISFLISLRKAARFDIKDRKGFELQSIPKRIAQFWHEQSLDPDIEDVTRSWSDMNSGWGYYLFDEGSARSYLLANCDDDVIQAYDLAREPAMKADLFRLAWLVTSGGCYADADDRCIAALDEFIPSEVELVVSQEPFGAIANNFMVALPHDPIISLALSCAVTSIIRGDQDLLWLCTGPGLLSRCFAKVLSESEYEMMSNLNRIVVFSPAELARVVSANCSLGYKRTRHLKVGRSR